MEMRTDRVNHGKGGPAHALGPLRWSGYDGVLEGRTWCGIPVYSVQGKEFHRTGATDQVEISETHVPACPDCLRVEPAVTALWIAQGAEFHGGRWWCRCGDELDQDAVFGTCGPCNSIYEDDWEMRGREI